jgi:hypothetical protein
VYTFASQSVVVGLELDSMKLHLSAKNSIYAQTACVLTCMCVAGTLLQDLPRNPSAACATPEIQKAFVRCKAVGPSAVCCKGLDAVFADSSTAAG